MPIVLTRATKLEARYKALGGAEHCSACRFYMPQGTCGRIIGPVSPEGWCKYYSREAVQRWSNPGYAGLGGLFSTASLNLNFMQAGTLDPRITFTRASTGTYFDSNGVMRTAAVNQPRWDYDPVTLQLRGLLLEDARTNLWLQSADASNAAWTKQGITVAAPIVTANQTAAPDGTVSAASVVYPAVATGPRVSTLTQNLTVTAVPYTFSVWMKGTTGTEVVYLSATPDTTLFYRQQCVLSTQWQRFALTTPALTAVSWAFSIGNDARNGGPTTAAATVFVWGTQVEAGGFATSLIPTTGAPVVRSIDNCVIPSANMSPWFVSPGGSWFAEFIAYNANNTRILGRPAAAGISQLYLFPARQVAQYDGSVTNPTLNGIALGAVSKGVSNFTAGTGKTCANGGAIATAALTTGYALLSSNGVGFFTTGGAGSVDNTSGYIRRVSYWPRVLTDAEMQQVTT